MLTPTLVIMSDVWGGEIFSSDEWLLTPSTRKRLAQDYLLCHNPYNALVESSQTVKSHYESSSYHVNLRLIYTILPQDIV